jgi:hypothetical protein
MKKKKQLTIPIVPREPPLESRQLIDLFQGSIEIFACFVISADRDYKSKEHQQNTKIQ